MHNPYPTFCNCEDLLRFQSQFLFSSHQQISALHIVLVAIQSGKNVCIRCFSLLTFKRGVSVLSFSKDVHSTLVRKCHLKCMYLSATFKRTTKQTNKEQTPVRKKISQFGVGEHISVYSLIWSLK